MRNYLLTFFFLLIVQLHPARANTIQRVYDTSFVKRSGTQFMLNGKPYHYIGTNYWYGALLGIMKDKKRGISRLRSELDFLQKKGITNLRVLAGAEGEGKILGVTRVGPSLQPEHGKFDTGVLYGLDMLLNEMAKRNMKAVIYFSNNWEWSGGFLQYLNWNGRISDSVLGRRLNWDEQRDYTSTFYACEPCMQDYLRHVKEVLNRTNTISHTRYINDPTIMSWELANEPRPMRPALAVQYEAWISSTSAYIKSVDKNHLVTIGHEGTIGVAGDQPLYESIQALPHIDYLTIHIWPKNWEWFRPGSMKEDFQTVIDKTNTYIEQHVAIARKLKKPLVIEEFGLPRDNQSFDTRSTTTLRDAYFQSILRVWKKHTTNHDVINGINFWAFGGKARPIPGQIFWKPGDDYMGDPPMEEQGLNTVFDGDGSTWKIIASFTRYRKQ